MGNPIVHFEIRSDDPDAARAFYGRLFGWTYPAGGFPGYTYVDAGVPAGSTIPGGISPLQGGNSLVTVFAGVPDVRAALDQAVALGGTIVQPATQAPGVTFGLFADPQGSRRRGRLERHVAPTDDMRQRGLGVSPRGPASRW